MAEYGVGIKRGEDGSAEIAIKTAVSAATVLLSPSEVRRLINLLERCENGEVAL